MLGSWVLQLQQCEGEAIDHHQNIGTTVLAILHDRELVDRHPVVVRWLLEVHQPETCCAELAVIATVLDRHIFSDELMQARILVDRALRISSLNRLDCFVDQRGIGSRVDPCQRSAEPAPQDHVLVRGALSARLARGNIGSVQAAVAQLGEILKSSLLNNVLVEVAHHALLSSDSSTQRANTLSVSRVK